VSRFLEISVALSASSRPHDGNTKRLCLHPNAVFVVRRRHHVGENCRGDARNPGCEQSRFGESRTDGTQADALSIRTDPKTTAPAVIGRRNLAELVTHSRRIHGSGRVARRSPLHGPWRSHRLPFPIVRFVRRRGTRPLSRVGGEEMQGRRIPWGSSGLTNGRGAIRARNLRPPY